MGLSLNGFPLFSLDVVPADEITGTYPQESDHGVTVN